MSRGAALFVYNKFFRLLPETRFFKLKAWWLSICCGFELGENVRIMSSVVFQCSGRVIIGNNVWISEFTKLIGGSSSITIEDNVDIGPNVLIVSGTHHYNFTGTRVAGLGYSKNIHIGQGCWIGANSTILGGSLINSMTLIAAGSLVTGRLDRPGIYGGTPAKLIKDATSL